MYESTLYKECKQLFGLNNYLLNGIFSRLSIWDRQSFNLSDKLARKLRKLYKKLGIGDIQLVTLNNTHWHFKMISSNSEEDIPLLIYPKSEYKGLKHALLHALLGRYRQVEIMAEKASNSLTEPIPDFKDEVVVEDGIMYD